MATQSEKGKIVYLFSFMTMVFVVLCYLSVQQLWQSNHIRIIDEGIESEHRTSLEIFKTDVDFFGYELNNSEFFKTGNSTYLERHDSLMNQIGALIKKLTKAGEKESTIETSLIHYDSTFKEIVNRIKRRGYEDYGLEGKMRSFAHELENQELIPKVDLLTLRRHEKNYLLRSENRYVEKFDSLIHQLKGKIKAPQTVELLDNYSNSFHELVKTSDIIGLEKQANLKGRLNSMTKQLISVIEELDRRADNETMHSYQRGMTFLAIGIIGCTILCIASIILIARKL